MLSWVELGALSLLYILSLSLILHEAYRSFRRERFSFHLLFTLTYLLVFYLGFPLSIGLSFGFDVRLNDFAVSFETLFISTAFYAGYYAAYRIRLLPRKAARKLMLPQAALNAKTDAKLTALLLLLTAGLSMLVFFVMNGLLLFKLEAYNQIFSAQVKGVSLKRFFYFFIPALLILYFIVPSKKNWWLFLFFGLSLGILSYLLIGGTRANIALVIALFVFIGIAQGYISIPALLGTGAAGILVMFVLAMKRYNLDLTDSKAIYYFLQLTRDTFSPWENLARLLAHEEIEYQGLMPVIRDFYVYIPRSLWETRPDLVLNTANYFTWDVLNYYAGLAISPTLIGSYYIMGGIPFVALGAVVSGLIIKGFDALYFYAGKLPYISRSAVWKAYCFANIFTITVLVREGIDAFISRFVLLSGVFFACYIGAVLITVGLKKAGFVSITVTNVEGRYGKSKNSGY